MPYIGDFVRQRQIATDIIDDAVTIAKLAATGTASNSTYLRGDNAWATVSTPITALNNATANELLTVGSTTTELDAESKLTFDGSVLIMKDENDAVTLQADQYKRVAIGTATSNNGRFYVTNTGGIPAAMIQQNTAGEKTLLLQGGGTGTGVTLECQDSAAADTFTVKDNGDVTCVKGDIVFGTAGKGICLGVTSNTDANTLDDYEEGTWTAGFAGGSGSVTINTSYDLLSYTKIGNIVHISGRIRISSVSSPSGEIYISGLPFAPTTATGEDTQHQYIGIHFRSAASDVGAVSGQTGTSSIQLYEAGTTGNTAVGDKIGGGTIIMIGGSYRTDS